MDSLKTFAQSALSKKKLHRKSFLFVGSIFALALAGVGISKPFLHEGHAQRRVTDTPSVSPTVAADEAEQRRVESELNAAERSTIDIFGRTSPSVVFITTLAAQQRDFFRQEVAPSGSGSGIVWDNNGNIVTNFHVVRGAAGAKVTLSDRSVWDARLVGAYPSKDLAVLHIDAPPGILRPLPRGTSNRLLVGQHVLAIGNPFGFDHTLSTGVISGLNREINSPDGRPIQGVIQTDAAINPGNSGGPLIDSRGRLIGINTAIFSPSGASAGIGFSIPVDTMDRIVSQLIAHGRVTRPGLGLMVDEAGVARRLGVRGGVLILRVHENSEASRAGVLPVRYDPRSGRVALGDVIVAIDGQRLVNAVDLYRELDRREVGQQVTLRVERDGRQMDLPLRLVPETDEN